MITIKLDVDRDYTFDNALDNVSLYCLNLAWNYGGVTFGGQVGTYAEILPPSRSIITLVDLDDRFNLSDSGSAYYGKLKRGVLVRGSVTSNSQQLFEHRIVRVSSTSRSQDDGSRIVTLECNDPMENWAQSSYIARLQKSVRIDEIIADMVNDATLAYPYAQSGAVAGIAIAGASVVQNALNFIDLEQARTTLDYAGDIETDDTSVQAYLGKHLPAEGGGRLFWSRSGKVRFHDRYFDATQAITITLDNDDLQSWQTANGANLANFVKVSYAVRELGTPATKIAEATNLPIKGPQGSYKNFTLRYRDFSGNDLAVASDNVITPVVGTDVICYDGESGGVIDNDFVRVGVDRVGAKEIQFSVNNPSSFGDPRSKDRWIHTLQVRGTPLYSRDKQEAVLFDAESIHDNGKHALQLNYNVIHDADFAESLARYTLNKRKTAREDISSLTFVVHTGNIGTLSGLDIGSSFNLSSSHFDDGATMTYVVVGQEWSIVGDVSQPSTLILHVFARDLAPVAIAGIAIAGTTSATVAL